MVNRGQVPFIEDYADGRIGLYVRALLAADVIDITSGDHDHKVVQGGAKVVQELPDDDAPGRIETEGVGGNVLARLRIAFSLIGTATKPSGYLLHQSENSL